MTASTARPAQAARWPPAEWPRVTTRVRSRSRSSSVAIAARTSSRVLGHAASDADAAVLDVQRGPALLDQVGGERPPEREVVGRLPEPAVDHHDDAPRRAVGKRELDELARVVAVPDRLGPAVPPPAHHRRARRQTRGPHRARGARGRCGASRAHQSRRGSVGEDDGPGLGAGRADVGAEAPVQVMPTRPACDPPLSASVAVSWIGRSLAAPGTLARGAGIGTLSM